MNTRRTPARRVKDNEVQEQILPQVEEVEKVPQGDQVPIVGEGDDIPKLSNMDSREALFALARGVTTQVNLSMGPRGNLVERTMTSRLRDFVRMNPLIFLGFKVGEDPQEFLDGVYKVLSAMGVKSRRRWSWLHIN